MTTLVSVPNADVAGTHVPPRQPLRFGDFQLLLDVDLLYRDDLVVPLEPRAVRVLRYLVQHHSRVIPKRELLDQVWPDVVTTEAVLKKAVWQIRCALGDVAGEGRFIRTHHRRGYCFVAPVEVTPPALEAATRFGESAAALASDPDFGRLVGREKELAALQAEYRRVLGGTGRPVLVTGEPGIGKTQLACHFQRWATDERASCLYARFFDYAGSRLAPYEVFLDLLRTALQGPEAARPMTIEGCRALRSLVEARLGVVLPTELFEATGDLPAGGSTGSPFGDRFRAIAPIGAAFLRLSQQRPVVLLLDDLQWADEADRDVIGYLMRTVRSEPLMILALIRTAETNGLDAARAEWLKRQATYRSFTCLPLSAWTEDECRSAVYSVFGGMAGGLGVPDSDLLTLHRITGGNPYFVSEMLRRLVAEGAIALQDGAVRWEWRGLTDLRLPDTLIMAARDKLDCLPPSVRRLIEQAAVIGEEFRVETLARMTGRDEEEVDTLLGGGVSLGVLSSRGLSAGEDYRFYHSILRQVLYDDLSPRLRRVWHAAAARALEVVYVREIDRVAAAISAHYEAAGDLRHTCEFSLRAWRAARARWQWPEAVASIERARRAADALVAREGTHPSTAERLQLLLGLGEGYGSVGRLTESEALLARTVELAQAAGDEETLASALLHQATTRAALGLYNESGAAAERAAEIRRRHGPPELVATALLQWASAQVARGKYEAVRPAIEQVVRDASPAGLSGAAAAGVLGWVLALQGRYENARPLLERALRDYQDARDLRGGAQILRRLHWVHLSCGRYRMAVELARRALDDFRRMGDANGEAKALMGIGQARVGQGLHEEALALLGSTLESLRSIGAVHCEAETLWLMARAHREAGRLEEASTLLRTALGKVTEIGDQDDEFRMLTESARVRLGRGVPHEALEAADRAVEIATALQSRDGLGAALAERARACLALGRRGDALMAAERAVQVLEETGSGERWRAHWVLASALHATGSSLETNARSHVALVRAVHLLDEMRREIGPDDERRWSLATQARSGPALDLCQHLRADGLVTEAESVAREWMV